MSELQNYYDEHASQARQHENQRERMTNIVLAITGALTGFITFSGFSLAALAASLAILALGVFGFFFAGKHYERFRFHTSIMAEIRHEMEQLRVHSQPTQRSLSKLREAGGQKHYREFKWPRFRRSNDPDQANASSWIARQRLHPFWELLHLLVAAIGLALSVAIVFNATAGRAKQPVEIRLVK